MGSIILIVSNWPKFKLIQALMVVLVTCKNDKDPSKNERTYVLTTFLSLYSYECFPNRFKGS